jgi:sugar phosphate isomerase/epimerase
MNLKDRIGVDLGRRVSLEEGVAWAAERGVKYIDAQLDITPNDLTTFDVARCDALRDAAVAADIHLGLHTLSGVNIAEYSPFLSEAVDAYLKAYIDVAVRLKAEWVVVHPGHHFGDKEERMEAAVGHIAKASAYAEEVGATLFLENMNWEPEQAEVHYLAHTVKEAQYYFERLTSPNLKWSFTVNHAHLVPDGIDGFINGLDMNRLGEVRIADCTGEYEIHMKPGEGNIDFGDMFKRIEASGFKGHYMNAFGSLEEMNDARAYLTECAAAVGVDVDSG